MPKINIADFYYGAVCGQRDKWN